MMKKTYFLAATLLVIQTLICFSEASASSRTTKKIGVGVGLLTEPFPSIVGFNASYNLAKFLRLGVGFGTVSGSDPSFSIDVKTIAVDAKFFPLDWNIAPFADIGYCSISGTISGSGTANGISLNSTGSSIYYGGGIDWQTNIGFNLGLEFKTLTLNGKSLSAPGAYIGWYF